MSDNRLKAACCKLVLRFSSWMKRGHQLIRYVLKKPLCITVTVPIAVTVVRSCSVFLLNETNMGTVIHVCLCLLVQLVITYCIDDLDSVVIDLEGKLLISKNIFSPLECFKNYHFLIVEKIL